MPISITDFKTWAAQNQGTAVAVDTASQTLVNASTQISTFDRIFRRGAVKAVRGAAIADFTRALSVRYGTSIAQEAISAAGLSSTSKLTGKTITDVVAGAKQIRSRLLSQSAGADLRLGNTVITQAQMANLGQPDLKLVKHFRNQRAAAIEMLGETPLSATDYDDFHTRMLGVLARLRSFVNSIPAGPTAGDFATEANALIQALLDKDAQSATLLANRPLSQNNIQNFKAVWREAALNALVTLRGTTTDQNTIGAINAAINDINANPQTFDQRIPLTRKTVKALTSVVADCIKEQLKLRNARGVKFRDSAIAASLAAGYRQALNERLWPVINKTFAATAGNRPVKLTSTITPADNFQPGAINYPQGIHGYMCHSADTDHAVNLAVSSLTVQGPVGTELAFCGVRHGVHSAWELPTAASRANANVHRAEEAVIAAFMAKYDLPTHPQALPAPDANGTINVTLDMVSVSLLTPDTIRHYWLTGSSDDERSMLTAQTQAWNSVAQLGVTFQYQGQQIRVMPTIHTFNFGVNSGAVNHSSIMPNVFGGWDLSDSMNTAAMAAFRQDVTAFINNPNQPAAKRTAAQTLLAQCDQVLNVKGERKDSHDAYKVAARIAVLANLIGAVPCWNCKSGKDRTGEMDVECKFLSTLIARGEDIPAPGAPLTKDQQALFRAIALEGGNFEVQKANTGFEGYKTKGVDSIPERLGGKKFHKFHAGGSKYVGV
jgi:hypothetical protein